MSTIPVFKSDADLRLPDLNSKIRRIDLSCKLLGPLLIALVNGVSSSLAILTALGMNVASVVVEYVCIARVS